MKPRVFIASSVEGVDVAKVINLSLNHVSTNTMWTDAFQLSSLTLPALIEQPQKNDFAIFVFSPDDDTVMRGVKNSDVRGNILFELGMFVGTLGAKRCFVVKPRSVQLHIPTDLLGVTLTDYDGTRPKADLKTSLNAPCTQIEHEMNNISASLGQTMAKGLLETPEYNDIEVSPHAQAVLLQCLENQNETLNLVHLRDIDSEEHPYFKQGIDELVQLGFLRLLRKDLATKELVYQMTSLGRDFILDNEVVSKVNYSTQTSSLAMDGASNKR